MWPQKRWFRVWVQLCYTDQIIEIDKSIRNLLESNNWIRLGLKWLSYLEKITFSQPKKDWNVRIWTHFFQLFDPFSMAKVLSSCLPIGLRSKLSFNSLNKSLLIFIIDQMQNKYCDGRRLLVGVARIFCLVSMSVFRLNSFFDCFTSHTLQIAYNRVQLMNDQIIIHLLSDFISSSSFCAT